MSKRIDTTQIVSQTSKQPFTGRSLAFLQDYNEEDKAVIIKALVKSNLGSYSLTVPYVISGCVVSDAGKDVTAGEIFYGGKFYETTAVNGATNVARFILAQTQDATADPLVFSDSVSKTVHNIFKYIPTDVASGGDFTSSSLVSAYGAGKITVSVQAANQSTTSNVYADLTLATYTTPNDGITRTWIISCNSTCTFTPQTAVTTGGKMRIYNGTIALGECESKFSTTTTEVSMTLGCTRVISIPPNTTIKIQILSLINASANVQFNDNQFNMTEV